MARTVKDENLSNRTQRRKLKPRGRPYFRSLDPGLHLGYRRLRNAAGSWVVRLYLGDETYETRAIATADDFSDPNGVDVLDFSQAQAKAREMRDGRSTTAGGISGPYTVARCLDDYFNFLRSEGRRDHLVNEAEQRAGVHIADRLGEVEVSALTAKQLRTWRDNLVKSGARLRTRKGQPQQYREIDDDDALRARRASANRTWAIFRAALNHAFREDRVTTDREWRKVKSFKGVDSKRPAFLTVAEAKRLINASSGDFRLLVQAALQTGARYSSLARLKVRDFHERAGTLDVLTYKGGGSPRSSHVQLTDEGISFFRQLCLGHAPGETMLTINGKPWGKDNQCRPMKEACERAKINPVGINQLRHTWASLALMNGTPLLVVAENLGHTDTRMVELHYGHITRQYAKEKIQEGAPKFGFKPDKTIVQLLGARR